MNTSDLNDLEGWLRLTLTPGVGNGAARKLLAAFGLPQAIFVQSVQALAQVVSQKQAQALARPPDGLPAALIRARNWLDSEGRQRCILPLGHAFYPPGLLDIEDPPVLLYAQGRVALLPHAKAAVAMVGSRSPTPQGALNARQFAKALVQAGFTVVSGLALGVDAAAHQGALDAAIEDEARVLNQPDVEQLLPTIAVIGTGLDRVYPKANLALAHGVAEHGVILSEYPLGTPPLAANFPKRNRLISGLSLGTLVVEAALQSGSLITARMASEQGKEVLAIPGSIHAVQSRGCHALIKQGAKLVECAEDVLEELRPQMERTSAPLSPHRAKASTPAPEQMVLPEASGNGMTTASDLSDDPILAALGYDPVSLDALSARTGWDAAALQAHLLDLELDGCVNRLPGGLFLRMAQA